MSGAKTGVEFEFKGEDSKLNSTVSRMDHQIHAFGNTVKNSFSTVNRYLDAATQHFGFFGTAVTAFTSGAVLKKLFSVADYMPLDSALLMMQARLHMTVKDTASLRQSLAGLAGKEGVDIKALFGKATGLAGPYGATEVPKILAATARATRTMKTDFSETTDVMVQMMKMFGKTADEAEEVADRLIAANVKDVESLSMFMQRYALRGGSGKDIEDMLGLKGGLARAGLTNNRIVMSIAQVLEAVDRHPDILKRSGINPFKIDPKTKEKTRKDTLEIMRDIGRAIDAAKGRGMSDEKIKSGLDKAFGGQAGDAIYLFLNNMDKIKAGYDAQGNAAKIAAERGAAAANTWDHHLSRVKETLAGIKTDLSWIYDIAKAAPKWFAEHPNVTKGAAYAAAFGALGVGGYMISKKGAAFLKGIGSTAAGIAEGKALEQVAGVTPVFVTNWPGTFGPGGIIPAGGKAGEVLKNTAAKYAPLGLTAVGAGGTAAAALLAGVEIRRQQLGDERITEMVRQSERGRGSSDAGRAMQNVINMNIRVDQNGRSTVETDDMATKVNVNRGNF